MSRFLQMLFGSVLAVACVAQAAPQYDLTTPNLAARVNGEAISREALGLLWRIAQQRKPEVSEVEVLGSVIEDRLLAAYALQHYPRAQLLNENRVGFQPDVALRDQQVTNWSAAFHREIQAALSRFKGGSLRGSITVQNTMSAADWLAVMGSPQKLLLEYRLSEAGRQAAQAKTLLRYRFDEKHTGSISMAEVYDAQNVQGRNRLHQRDNGFLQEAQGQLLASRFVLFWVETQSGLPAADRELLARAVTDRALRDGLTTVLGITADMHADNAHMKQLAAAVTPEQVRAYYAANKDQFKRIEKVKAAHISLADFDSANKAYAELKRGTPFAEVARRHSLAADREQGGDLGWIVHEQGLPSWLQSLAFTQAPGTVSKPFRSPAAPGFDARWEILKVDERVEGYQDVDSESVRYTASQVLARQTALREFQALRSRLLDEADIHIQASLKPARGSKP